MPPERPPASLVLHLVVLLGRLQAALRGITARGERITAAAAEMLPPAGGDPRAAPPPPAPAAAGAAALTPAREDALRSTVLWFGMLGAQGAWFAQLMLAYMAIPAACETSLRIPLYLISTAAAAVAVASMAVAWRIWRRAPVSGLAPDIRARRAFMGLTGVLLGGLALAVIVMSAVSPALIGPCA